MSIASVTPVSGVDYFARATATEQKPTAGASVVVVPDAEGNLRSDLFRRLIADQNGNFSLAGMAPGKYRAFALESVDDLGVFLDPQASVDDSLTWAKVYR